MSTLLYIIAVIYALYVLIEQTKKFGWVAMWNAFFIFLLILALVVSQKYIGKIEGSLLAIVPFITGQILIKKNKKIQSFYFSKQTKFINWCNKYIYHLD